jgi:hypothetical protein
LGLSKTCLAGLSKGNAQEKFTVKNPESLVKGDSELCFFGRSPAEFIPQEPRFTLKLFAKQKVNAAIANGKIQSAMLAKT